MGSPCSIEQPRHFAALGARLVRDEGHAVDLVCQLVGLGRVLRELDAAAFAPAPRVNLRFDDDRATTESFGHAFCVRCLEDRLALWNRHAVLRKNLFGLILVNFHMCETVNRSVRCLSASSCCE